MNDDASHWRDLARRVGIERDGRALKRQRIVRELDWSGWSTEEREVYAAAFLFPAPAEPLIDNITIEGHSLKLSRLSRTATIIDEAGAVWRVVEHGRPEKIG